MARFGSTAALSDSHMILSLALLLSGRLDTRPAQQLQAEEAAASPPRQSEVRSSHSPGETTLRVLEEVLVRAKL